MLEFFCEHFLKSNEWHFDKAAMQRKVSEHITFMLKSIKSEDN